MNLVFISTLLLVALVVFSAQEDEEEKQEAGTEEDEEWPYIIHIDTCEIDVDPSFGTGKCKAKKPKGEKVRKMTLTIDLHQEILCSLQVTMVAKIKSNGNWVDNYQSEPKDFDSYYKQTQDIIDDVLQFGNLTICPIAPGYYEIKEYFADHTKFPKKLECGEYMVVFELRHGSMKVAEIEVGAFLECLN